MLPACGAARPAPAPSASGSTVTTTAPVTTAPAPTTPDDLLCRPLPPGRTSVILEPRWAVGSHVDLEIQEASVATGWPADASSTVHDVSVDVVERTEGGGWVFRWTADVSVVERFGLASGPEIAAHMGEVPVHQVNYELSEDRLDVVVADVEGLREEARLLADGVEVFDSTPAGAETRAEFDAMGDDELGDVFLYLPVLFHAFEGVQLSFGEPVEFATTLPNALGGPEFPAVGSIELTDLIDDDGCMALLMTIVPDPEHFEPLLADSFRVADPKLSDEEVDARVAAAAAYEFLDTYVAKFDAHTQRFHRIDVTSRTSDGTFVWLHRTSLIDVGDKEPVVRWS